MTTMAINSSTVSINSSTLAPNGGGSGPAPPTPYVPILKSIYNPYSEDKIVQITPSTAGFTSTFSMTTWVKVTVSHGNRSFLSIKDASGTRNNAIHLGYYQSGATQCVSLDVYNGAGSRRQAGLYNVLGDNTIIGNWCHITFTWNGAIGGAKVYKNGVVMNKLVNYADSDGTGMTDDADRVVRVGCDYYTAGNHWGYFYSGAFYTVELDQLNVTALYNAADGTTMDQMNNSGGYTQSAACVSMYMPGAGTDAAGFGLDRGQDASRHCIGASWDSDNLYDDIPNGS